MVAFTTLISGCVRKGEMAKVLSWDCELAGNGHGNSTSVCLKMRYQVSPKLNGWLRLILVYPCWMLMDIYSYSNHVQSTILRQTNFFTHPHCQQARGLPFLAKAAQHLEMAKSFGLVPHQELEDVMISLQVNCHEYLWCLKIDYPQIPPRSLMVNNHAHSWSCSHIFMI